MHRLLIRLSGGSLARRVTTVFDVFQHQQPLPACRRLPQGYVLRRIKPTDRVRALRDWSARFMECEEAFVRLCDVLPSLAVYKVCESDDGGCEEELTSSALLRSN